MTIPALNTFTKPTDTNLKTVMLKATAETDKTGLNEYEMSVWLYADPIFDTWKAAV